MSKSDTEETLPHSRPGPEASSIGPPADCSLPRNKSSHGRMVAHGDSCSSISSDGQSSYIPYQPPLGLPSGYSPQTPFPSQVEGCFSTQEPRSKDWLQPGSYSSFVGGYSRGSNPSCLVSGDYRTDWSEVRSSSLLERNSPGVSSLEQPHSLHSIPTTLAQHGFYLDTCSCYYGPSCGGSDQRDSHWGNAHAMSYHVPSSSSCPKNSKQSDQEFIHRDTFHPGQKSVPSTTPLSLKQRKVFVTYEADCDKHVKEVINFVALLRHNGFYTHIDMFEQQFRSISKIDFMERYITEKDYLIIIIISPKYYEIVTRASLYMENDETLNTVYIHRQLQNEFIQNGCKNFRFVPVLFPGAKKCHVPSWLQNTHIFSWPRDRDDILRRLMRVEKYNPPPIGQLPTIVSMPI
ncbi:uncharacterized protein traf3ip2l isoform X2 [Brachyhypopomus gauderio]